MPSEGFVVVDHPAVRHRMGMLRDARTANAHVARLVHEVTTFVAYEALRDLATEEGRVATPVSPHAAVARVAETVLLVPVLRAGLGMVPAVQALLPFTEVACVGLRRDESTLEADVYLDQLPAHLEDRRVVVCDPMLATGGTLARVCDLAQRRGARRVQALCLIASVPGLERFRTDQPGVPVACAAVDPELDERGYIVPGLGDAGDRLFGPLA
jgi:uracil phosphoribosyltransferase